MAPKDKFRQPGAQHFQLVHRSQRDPLIHDPEASTHIFKPFERENAKKGKSRADLEKILSPADLEKTHARPNIGHAAEYGVYFDDTEYDYMQHLRTVGEQQEGVESVLLEAKTGPARMKPGKGKSKDILTIVEPVASSSSIIPPELLAPKTELPRNYESQQNIPTSIAGFQPDMNPHLRQTLEALEDDAFVNEELEDDFFGELLAEGEVSNESDLDFPFEEWGVREGESIGHQDSGKASERPEDEEEEGWEARFARFKRDQGGKAHDDDGNSATERDVMASEGGDTVGTLPHLSVKGIRKRRRHGGSDASGYSMSSSSMYRNEHLTILDEQFDHIMEKQYNPEDEEFDEESPSTHDDDDDDEPPLLTAREDFDSILDEFMDKYEVVGGKFKPALEGDIAASKLGTLRQALAGVDLNEEAKTKAAIKKYAEEYTDEEPSIPIPYDVDDIRDRWDCETILSTYSNLENHPRIIRIHNGQKVPKIRLDPKTGLPITSDKEQHRSRAEGQQIAKSGMESIDRNVLRTLVSGENGSERIKRETVARSRNETKEEKLARKQAVKEDKLDRRANKKQMKEIFASEKRGQAKAQLNRVQGGQGLKKL